LAVRVHSTGLFTTVQDLGRPGAAHLGVSPAGAADPLALRVGNLLVGNRENAAALELLLIGGRYEFLRDATIALTGAEFDASIPLWTPVAVTAGQTIDIRGARIGARGYLCIRGGIESGKIVLGSQSTHILSGFGVVVKKLDELAFGGEPAGAAQSGVVVKPPAYRKRLRVTAGAQASEFDALQALTLLSGIYRVSDDSNRMGLRLSGPPLHPPHEGQMLSEGVALGAIQVPPGGDPIILFVDAQTTGGYPVIASVISADLPSVGQLRPRDEITFEAVTVPEARQVLFEQEAWIHAIGERED
jgi:biotin-dependent carboxylase-like uncharacterized protein